MEEGWRRVRFQQMWKPADDWDVRFCPQYLLRSDLSHLGQGGADICVAPALGQASPVFSSASVQPIQARVVMPSLPERKWS